MRILGISGSPRKKGNTEVMVEEVLNSAREMGAEVELITIYNKKIAPCDGCESCRKTGKCRIDDDMQEIYSQMLEADGIVFGSPVYYWGVTAQAKAVIDRTFALSPGRKLRNKVAGAVVVARRSGATQAFSAFHAFFNIQRMITAAGAFGDSGQKGIGSGERGGGAIAYADGRGDVSNDLRGMAEAQALGQAMVMSVKQYK